MYAIALIRYRRPLDEVLAVLDQHRAYLRGLKEAGTLIASGPMDPRTGGVLLLRVPDANVHGAWTRFATAILTSPSASRSTSSFPGR
jgi:uncharacterized protein YciI